MKSSIEKKILIGLIINIVVAIAFGWVSYKRIKNKEDLSFLVENHYKIILSISKSLAVLNSNDNHAKAYVITGDETYLGQLTQGRFLVEDELKYLKLQFENNEQQKGRMKRIETLLYTVFHNTDEFIELKKYKNFEAAKDFIQNKERIRSLNEILSITIQLVNTENSEFSKKLEQTKRPGQILKTTFFVLLTCLIILLFVVYFILRNQLKGKEGAEKFLNSIIENIPSIIFIKDAKDLRFVLINKASEIQYGYKRNEVIGKNIYDLVPKEQADLDANQDRELLKKGESLNIPEASVTTKNGKTWLHTKKIPIKDEAGKPVYLLEIAENITEQKILEEKRKETEKVIQQNTLQVKLILENIGEGVILVDRYGEIILSNRMAGEIVGIKEDDEIYTPVDWAKDFDLFYADDNTVFPAQNLPLEKALLRGESTDNLEIIIQDPITKERKRVVVNGRPIIDENKNIVAAVTTLKDITRLTELQESLKTSETKYRDLIGYKTQNSKNIDNEKK